MASPQGSVSGGCGKFRTRSNVVCAMSSSASLWALCAALASASSTTEVDITQMNPKLRFHDLETKTSTTAQFNPISFSFIFCETSQNVDFWGGVVNGYERSLTDRKGGSRKVHGSFTVVSRYNFPQSGMQLFGENFDGFTILARERCVF